MGVKMITVPCLPHGLIMRIKMSISIHTHLESCLAQRKCSTNVSYFILLLLHVGFPEFCHLLSFLKKCLFIYLFLVGLGLHCCVQVFSSCGEQGLLLFIAVHQLLIVKASLVVEHGF